MQDLSSFQITRIEDVSSLGTILSVWAHPDDETYCCGGVMSWAANNGQRVVCVTATRGEAGSQDVKRWPPDQLAAVRAKEMERALEIFGISEHHWLDYPDGGCMAVDQDEAIEKLVVLIEQVKPDTVLTFGREGITGHSDHQAVCQWTHAALQQSGHTAKVFHPVIADQQYESHYRVVDEKLNMFFAIDEPPTKPAAECDICIELPNDVLNKKREAIRAMPSQTAIMLELFDEAFLDGMLSVECLVHCQA
jgi:LmbE family N-acetylglucosaminyl deacetylase